MYRFEQSMYRKNMKVEQIEIGLDSLIDKGNRII